MIYINNLFSGGAAFDSYISYILSIKIQNLIYLPARNGITDGAVGYGTAAEVKHLVLFMFY